MNAALRPAVAAATTLAIWLWPSTAGAITCSASQALHDQRNFASSLPFGVPYQDGSGTVLDSEAADDFTVPAGEVWSISSMTIDGFVHPSSFGPPDAVDVAFYLDAGGQPGALVCDYPGIKPASSGGGTVLTMDLPGPCTLCAGNHAWVVLQAVDSAGGDYTWGQRTVQSHGPAVWQNPGDGYGTGCTTWQPAAAACDRGDGVSPDLLFSLSGRKLTASRTKGDFNGDLCTDVAFQNSSTNAGQLWTMNGATRVAEVTVNPVPPAGWTIQGSDHFNGDIYSDLVLRHGSTGDVQFWLMDGSGNRVGKGIGLGGLLPRPTSDLTWKIVATGDMDGDGQADLVWRNTAEPRQVEIWTLEGTDKDDQDPLHPDPASTVDANWEVRAAMDFSGDNLPDLLWQNTTSAKTVLWFLDENLVRTSGDFTDPDGPIGGVTNWKVLAAGDYGIGAKLRPDLPPGTEPEPVCGSNDFLWQNDDSAKTVVWYLDFNRRKTGGGYTSPDGPGLGWLVVGPR